MNICVFKRYELKYLLTLTQYYNVLKEAKDNLIMDRHGESTIQSLYYDTDDFRLIRRSLEKPEYKEKLRLRSYGLANENDTIFMELKRKCSGVVYKRRIEISSNAIKDNDLGNNQISKEIVYFMNFYKNLRPKMLLLYDRIAYFGEGDLRITFDRNIRYRTDRLSLSAGLDGTPIFDNEKILMEIKTGTSIPLWLVQILSKEQITKTSFSKYGEAYKIQKSSINIKEENKVG